MTFTGAGAELLKAAIQNNIGKVMAIIIDGKIVCQALLRNSMTGNSFVLETGMSRNEAVKLEHLLRKA